MWASRASLTRACWCMPEIIQAEEITLRDDRVCGYRSGLQKDREKNSASLVPLREADALAHVVRLFEEIRPCRSEEIGSLDAMRDIENVEIELILNDLEQARSKRNANGSEKTSRRKKDPLLQGTSCSYCSAAARRSKRKHRCANWNSSPRRRRCSGSFMFLTQKPMLYVLNLGGRRSCRN